MASVGRYNTMDGFFHQIDWRQPWLEPLQRIAEPIVNSSDWRAALNYAAQAAGIRNRRGIPIRFVPQADLPHAVAYEAFIGETGGVPTRDNLHDFFNALMWLTFPAIKVQLNALQAAEIARSSSNTGNEIVQDGRRGKLRDGATIFDENAALFLTNDDGLIDALRQHQWNLLFLARRDAFPCKCEIRLFGHALMEKLVKPYKAITAHTWIIRTGSEYFKCEPEERQAWIDMTVAEQLSSGLATTDFSPLPVLGIPGWWPIQDQQFYADAAVFRPARQVR
jgi:hypothetical protein